MLLSLSLFLNQIPFILLEQELIMSPKPSGNGVDGDDERGEKEDLEDEEEKVEEVKEDEEPGLKYQSMGGSVPSILASDGASCIAVAERMIALGTHGGSVHILDFLGNQVLHSGEGPVHAVKWRASLVAWANDAGVKVYDTDNDHHITFIERPRGCPRPELSLPHLVWQVDIVASFQTSNFISGIAPFGDSVVILAYIPGEEDGVKEFRCNIPLRQGPPTGAVVVDMLAFHSCASLQDQFSSFKH